MVKATLLALDVASTTGYAILAAAGELVTYGHANLRTDCAQQIATLAITFAGMGVTTVLIEAGYSGPNIKSGLDLATMRGRWIQALEALGITSIELVAPAKWRKTTIKPAHKLKRKELKALAKQYALEHFGIAATEDEADAICLAAHGRDTFLSTNST